MKKSYEIIEALVVTAMLFVLFSGRIEAADDNRIMIAVTQNPACSNLEYRRELADFKALKGYVIGRGFHERASIGTNELYDQSFSDRMLLSMSKADAINNKITKAEEDGTLISLGERWLLDNLKALKAQNTTTKSILAEYQAYFKSFLQCSVVGGLSVPDKLDMSPYHNNTDIKINLKGAEDKYPTKGDKPTVFIVDTVMNRDFIHDAHWPRIDPTGKSWINGEPAIKTDMQNYTFATHANIMSFLSLMVSDANVFNEAVTLSGVTMKTSTVYSAIIHATELKKPGSVINMSFSNGYGYINALEVSAIQYAVRAGIPVVKSTGNEGKKYKEDFDTNYPDLITVGYAVAGKMKSNFGKYGPDLLVDESGNTLTPNKNGGADETAFASVQSSGAAAIVSGIVSRMRNSCPKATPADIKSSLISSADKYTGIHSEYVKGGYVNTLKAIDKLMALDICKDLNAMAWEILDISGGNNIISIANMMPLFVSEITRSCNAQGGQIEDYVRYPNEKLIMCSKVDVAANTRRPVTPYICTNFAGLVKACNPLTKKPI